MLVQKKNALYWVLFIGCFFFVAESFAETYDMPVQIETVLPDNQKNQSVSYFDLKMSPSDKQKVTIKVSNVTAEPLKFKVNYSDAKTTSEGNIEYSENENLKLETPLNYSFKEIVSGPGELIVPAKSTEEVEFLLSMPEKSYDGSIAGGVEFLQEINEEEQGALVTQRSYLVGFKLSETDVKLPIDIDLGKTIVGTKNYKSAIIVPVNNLVGDYVEELAIQVEIIDESDQTIVMQSEKKMMRMAPFSTLEFPLYIEESLLAVGEYGMNVKVTAQDNFSKKWQQGFSVTKKDLELMKENQDLWNEGNRRASQKKVFFLILVITLVTLLIIILIRINHLRNKQKKGSGNGKKKKHK
ncbi:WxL protein peptidoglycan domain-containing protein [Vagococcus fluvialis]|uniref:DUF916 domain-containing protein n=1 Tax=Vagococcus fluvialis TaxID=2738 RepID=UPI002818BF46|nr:DUF916 and DUF3324 domain-containing protein [Vagococcus sp.]